MEDSLLGRWFWHDEAQMPAREFYCGQFVADLGMGCLLARFLPHEKIRPGTQEVVHVEAIVSERWSIFDTEQELMEAMG